MRDSSSHDKPIGAVMTPLRWAKWLVRESGFVSKWAQGATVCDPTAGRGVFAQAMIDVASKDGLEVDDAMLSRLFLIEREPEYLRGFHESFQFKYKRAFPKQNAVCADIVLENPGKRFDLLVGNPPWVNFNDLPQAYKEQLKSAFIANGLVDDSQLLLLGCARVDFSALVLAVAMKNNLKAHGEGIFFLPLSLFQNDGAHSGFRRYVIGDTMFRPTEIWAFTETTVFPEVATRFGAVRFERDATAIYPIPYRIEAGSGWLKRFAAPIGNANAPLAVLDSELEFEQLPSPTLIDVREGQKPRQASTLAAQTASSFLTTLRKMFPKSSSSRSSRRNASTSLTQCRANTSCFLTTSEQGGHWTKRRWKVIRRWRLTSRRKNVNCLPAKERC